jgi:methylated-DNA-[protein]-cysteine S-methyltransferase
VSDQHGYTICETRNGHVALAWTARGVSSLRLPSATAQAAEASVLRRLPDAQRAAPPPAIAGLIADIIRYFEGEKIDFAAVPVELGAQSDFFTGVYAHIRKLGWGETTTYGAVAKALDAEPQAARDVGQAMAANPVPLIVPCHRVLAAGGQIGGFSAPGGSSSKARMLEIEGAAPSAAAPPKAKSDQLGFDF